MEILEISKDGPSERSLELEIYLTATFRLDDFELLTGLHGVAVSSLDKLVGTIREAPEKREGASQKTLNAAKWWDSNRNRNYTEWNVPLAVTLSRQSLDHIESIRTKDPRGELRLTIKMTARLLRSRLLVSPTREVSVSGVAGLLAVPLEFTRWSPPRDNSWLISGDGSEVVLQATDQPFTTEIVIDSGRWIHDYAPALGRGRFLVAELPMPPQLSSDAGLNGRSALLARAFQLIPTIEEKFKAGEWDEVVKAARPVAKLFKAPEFVTFLTNELAYPADAADEFQKAVQGLFDFAAKPTHALTKERNLQPPLTIGKENAQMVYAMTVSLVNLVGRKWQKAQQ